MKTIDMTLDPKSIRSAISELKKYRNALETKVDRACRELAKLGVMSATFNTVVLAEGNEDFSILPVQGSKGVYRVVAKGQDVAFVEFGAGDGVQYPVGYPKDGFANQVYPGSWSLEHDGQYIHKGYWYYKNVKYYGTPASQPMYSASQDMRDNIATIFREVFGQ